MSLQGNLLITGASGFTGLHACSHFQNAGFKITAITRKDTYPLKNIEFESCDLTNKDQVKNLIKKIQPHYLLHLAGQNHVGLSWIDPISSLEMNSMSTAYLLDAIRSESPACQIVVVGSALQFDPLSISTLSHPYSLSKTLQALIAQSWAILYNMKIVIAKPSNLIGPGLSNGVCSILAQKIVEMEENKAEKVLHVNNLQSERDFLDVRDAVAAYEILLKKGKPGETYDITSGKSHSLKEIIDRYRAMTLVKFEVKEELNNHTEKQAVIRPVKTQKLGWKPLLPLDTSLSDTLDFYRNNM